MLLTQTKSIRSSDDNRNNVARKPKLAEQIARRIEDRILAEGWPVGHPLGREADLAAEQGVSRWTFREALRLLEQDGLVVSRRGSGGGLFVAAPMLDFVANGLSNYLEFIRIDPEEVVRIQAALEAAMIDRAIPAIDQATRDELEALANIAAGSDRPETFDATFRIRNVALRCADQPAITLIVRALSRLTGDATSHSACDDESFFRLLDEIVGAARQMALALVKGDRDRAHDADRAYLAAAGQLLRSSFALGQQPNRPGAVERAFRTYPAIKPIKKPERLAWDIRELIIERGWPVGWKLGSEAELMSRFRVGRSVLREAIRTLERLGVVTMGRGSASGLTVISPDPTQIVAASRRHLRRAGLTAAEAEEARGLIDAATASQEVGSLTSLVRRIIEPDA